MRVSADERCGAAVEVEILGKCGEEIKGDMRVGGVGEDEVLDGDHFEEVLVVVHELLECGVPCSRSHKL